MNFAVSCCKKVLLENFKFWNGFYEENGTRLNTAPQYFHNDVGQDQFLYYNIFKVDSFYYSGWIVSESVGSIGLSNIVRVQLL